MFGKFGEKLRDQMLQAGIRDPKAPMYFLLGRIILPIFLAGYGLLMFNKIENPNIEISLKEANNLDKKLSYFPRQNGIKTVNRKLFKRAW